MNAGSHVHDFEVYLKAFDAGDIGRWCTSVAVKRTYVCLDGAVQGAEIKCCAVTQDAGN
jgi:hypothetical protein